MNIFSTPTLSFLITKICDSLLILRIVLLRLGWQVHVCMRESEIILSIFPILSLSSGFTYLFSVSFFTYNKHYISKRNYIYYYVHSYIHMCDKVVKSHEKLK